MRLPWIRRPPLAVLRLPVVEFFHKAGSRILEQKVPAVRTGPDTLERRALDECPWKIKAMAYWYRNHQWCDDPRCRCRWSPRRGDGLCAIAFENGIYGFYRLRPEVDGTDPFGWAERKRREYRISIAELEQLRMDLRDIYAAAVRWSETPDAIVGVWTAVDEAIRRGWF